MRPINEIIIHCSATPEGKDYSVATIRKWHTDPKPKGNGWKDIGYHYVIYRDGTIHLGRPLDQIGAHTLNHNTGTIGICLIGGCAADGKTPKDTRTDAQKEALYTLCKILCDTLGINKISGHREYAAKACPSFDVHAWRKEVKL